jgi:hypothetical protein
MRVSHPQTKLDKRMTQQKTVNEYDQRQYSVNDLQ